MLAADKNLALKERGFKVLAQGVETWEEMVVSLGADCPRTYPSKFLLGFEPDSKCGK